MKVVSLFLHVGVIAAFLGLSLFFTYPLVLNFATHVPGDIGDAPVLTWNLWWIKFSLFDAQTDPLFTNYVFYPIGINLIVYTLTLFNGLLALPFIFLSNYVIANSLLVVLELALSAYGMYLLAFDRLSRARLDGHSTSPVVAFFASVFAGVIYGFGSYHLNYVARGQVNIAANQWLPFYLLFLTRALEQPRRARRLGMLAGVVFAFSAWTELTYAAFLGLLTAFYWLFHVRTILRIPRAFIQHVFILCGMAGVSVAPIMLNLLSDRARYGDYLSLGLARWELLSADLLSFALPSSQNPFFGFLTRDLPFQSKNWTFAGWVPIALGGLALVSIRAARINLWLTLGFAVLMLGPTLQTGGVRTEIQLPYNLLNSVPLLNSNRYSLRFNSLLMLTLTLAGSYATAYILARARGATMESRTRRSFHVCADRATGAAPALDRTESARDIRNDPRGCRRFCCT